MTIETVNYETGELTTPGDVINYEVHPVAALFPYIEGEAFREFVEDVRANGQREPVVLDTQGRLLDGRNRVRACQALGIDVKETRYSGDDVRGWIISHNVHRRHLTESQRAMIAARLANLPNGGDRMQQTTSPIGDVPPVTQADAASALNVAPRSVSRAKAVIKSGNEDLIKSVESGKTSIAKADKELRRARNPEPKPEPEPTAANSKMPVEQRAEQFAELAAQGYSSRQIAAKCGVVDEYVRRISREHDIDIPADRVMRRTKRMHDSTQIVWNTVDALESLVSGLRYVDQDDLDMSEASEWAASLTESLRVLNAFNRKIKEAAQ